MKKIITILLVLSLLFISPVQAELNSKMTQKIDVIFEKNLKSVPKLVSSLEKMKGKYKNQPEALKMVDDLLTYIDSKTKTEYDFVRTVDGDTIVVAKNGKEFNIRMIGIDAPESSSLRFWEVECFGKNASDYMQSMFSWAKSVVIEIDPSQGILDKYNRLLWYVYLDGVNVNQQMIRDGYAFEYTYSKAYKYQKQFQAEQKFASADKKWLWADNTCKWQRKIVEVKQETQKEVEKIFTPPVENKYSCQKKTCSAMSSCEEAKYQLFSCGNSSLDRDKDGIPCESICK